MKISAVPERKRVYLVLENVLVPAPLSLCFIVDLQF